jgi:toxin ParE1/3/4
LDRYSVKLLSSAYRSLDEIYAYIAKQLQAEKSALKLIDKLEEAIFSLEFMPQRGAKRRVGAYENKGFRQLFLKALPLFTALMKKKTCNNFDSQIFKK